MHGAGQKHSPAICSGGHNITQNVSQSDLCADKHVCGTTNTENALVYITAKFVDQHSEAGFMKMLVDTGATTSCLSYDFYAKCLSHLYLKPKSVIINGYAGGKVKSFGTIDLEFQLENVQFSHNFLVIPGVSHEAILGSGFLNQYKCMIDYDTENIHIKMNRNDSVSVPMTRACVLNQKTKVTVTEHTVLQPRCEVILHGHISGTSNLDGFTGLISRNENILMKHGIIAANQLVTVRDSHVPVRVANTTNKEVNVWPGQSVAFFKPDNEIINLVTLESDSPTDKTTKSIP